MPLSDDPEKREKQLANLQQEYGNRVLKEIQSTNIETVKKTLLELAPDNYPNLSALARSANVSRSYVVYLIKNDKEFERELEETFKRHLDEIEDNVLKTAKKEQYAGIAIGVLNKLHPRYKEEKQQIQANIQVNIGGLANPYDAKEIDANDSGEVE